MIYQLQRPEELQALGLGIDFIVLWKLQCHHLELTRVQAILIILLIEGFLLVVIEKLIGKYIWKIGLTFKNQKCPGQDTTLLQLLLKVSKLILRYLLLEKNATMLTVSLIKLIILAMNYPSLPGPGYYN